MQHQPRRSRLARILVGTLVGSLLSLGAVSGSASAGKVGSPTSGTITTEDIGGSTTSARSGIRW